MLLHVDFDIASQEHRRLFTTIKALGSTTFAFIHHFGVPNVSEV